MNETEEVLCATNEIKENTGTVASTSSSLSPSSERLSTVTDQDDFESSEENLQIPGTLIGAENYLTLTEGKPCALTKEELTEAVTKCKELILTSAVCSDERKWLVRRLIELRYQLLTISEEQESGSGGDNSSWPGNVREESASSCIVLGHHFKLRYEPTSTAKRYCDTCCSSIWNVVQSWYQCSDCRYRCHTKCVDHIARPCAHLLASEKPEYEKNICPEVGLASQNYKCAECKLTISFKNTWLMPRLCDYTGLYYCTSCHWNNAAVIPARVSHNWDLKPYLVSRAAYQLLRVTRHRTLIVLNPMLWGFVKELAEIKRLREELSLIKMYLVHCKEAKSERKLLWKQFGTRAHLLEPSESFSLQDLIDLNSGKLLDQMRETATKFTDHITKNCLLCKGQGYICELCDSNDILFPFYTQSHVCPDCTWVYHKACWQLSPFCRKCERNQKRKTESETTLLPEL